MFGAIHVSAETATVAVERLNIRSGPGTNYEVIGRLSLGDAVGVLSHNDEWVEISLPQVQLVGTITDDHVNIRAGSSTNTEILGRAQTGRSFSIYGLVGDFYRVEHEHSFAYIHRDFLESVEISQGFRTAYIAAEFVTIGTLVGTLNSNRVNLREAPSTTSNVLGRVNSGTEVYVFAVSGDFYRVEYNGISAYIHTDFINGGLLGRTSATNGTSNTQRYTHAIVAVSSGLRFRSLPNTDSAIIARLPYGTPVTLIAANINGWHRVSHNGSTGYISAEFSTLHTGDMPDNTLRTRVVNFAQTFLGLRYVWAGTNLNTGVDCSGFTQSIFAHFGISINRVSHDQFNNGTRVSREQIRPGDLVFFSYNRPGVVQHVGIYIGGGRFIHSASGNAMRVIISEMSNPWYAARFIGATNVIG